MKFDSKLTIEDHVRGIVSHVSQRIGILRLVKRIFVNTSALITGVTVSNAPVLLSGHLCVTVWTPLCYCVDTSVLFVGVGVRC